MLQKLLYLLDKENDEENLTLLNSSIQVCLKETSICHPIVSLHLSLHVLLSKFKAVKYVNLKLAILDTITIIVNKLESVDAVAPGVLSAMTSFVISSPVKTQHMLLVKSVEIVSLVVCKLCEHQIEPIVGMLKRLEMLVVHDHFRVRQAVCEFARSVIVDFDTLAKRKEYLPSLLKILVVGRMDEYESVSSVCMMSLVEMKCFDGEMSRVVKISFHEELQRMKGLMMKSEREQHFVLKVLSGYLVAFRELDEEISSVSCEWMMRWMIKMIKFEYSDVKIITELSVNAEFESVDSVEIPIERLLFASDCRVQKSIELLIELIGRCFPVEELMKFFESKLECEVEDVELPQVLYILSVIVNSWSSDSKVNKYFNISEINDENKENTENKDIKENTENTEINEHSIPVIVKESVCKINELLNNLTVLNKPSTLVECQLYSIESENKSVSHFNRIIITKCLLGYSILACSKVLRSEYKPLLINSLFVLLVLSGDNLLIINEIAMKCFNKISKYCGYESCKELLMDNMDYALNATSIKLLTINENPSALKVLISLINFLHIEVLPFVSDLSIQLFDLLEEFSESKFIQFGILKSFQLIFSLIKDEKDFNKLKFVSEFCKNTLNKIENLLLNDSMQIRVIVIRLSSDIVRSFFHSSSESRSAKNSENINSSETENRSGIISWFSRNWKILFKRLINDRSNPFIIEATLDLFSSLAECIEDFFSHKYLESELFRLFEIWLLNKSFQRHSSEFDLLGKKISSNLILENSLIHSTPSWLITNASKEENLITNSKSDYSSNNYSYSNSLNFTNEYSPNSTSIKLYKSILKSFISISLHLKLQRFHISVLFNLTMEFLFKIVPSLPRNFHDEIVDLIIQCFKVWCDLFPEFIWFNFNIRSQHLNNEHISPFYQIYSHLKIKSTPFSNHIISKLDKIIQLPN
ncbi:hypothetical protein ROZALSC1DRAFT_23647 [Rozella allomycis CSF55]|uniref:Uncharacterized protein n=1 Tax=Rozella allomycis (strain CSF55) TaxID=988480 RepID=A0A4P9YFJ5_ROZAC|nr:hypothetical protein ROZALSC1DRAFT_23647 [Rozella allomycis CSF55]